MPKLLHITLVTIIGATFAIAADQTKEEESLPSDIPSSAVARDEIIKPSGGVNRKQIYSVNDRKVGERWYYDNGKLAEQKLFRWGELHGIWTQYYRDGQLFAERPYRDGKPDGDFRFWNQDGKLLGHSMLKEGHGVLYQYPLRQLNSLHAEIPYVDGKIDGIMTMWSDSDAPDSWFKELTQYKDGKKEGWSVVYRKDGSLFSTAYCHNDRLHGVARDFDPEGNVKPGRISYLIVGDPCTKDQYLDSATQDKVLRITLDHDRPSPEEMKPIEDKH